MGENVGYLDWVSKGDRMAESESERQKDRDRQRQTKTDRELWLTMKRREGWISVDWVSLGRNLGDIWEGQISPSRRRRKRKRRKRRRKR